MNEKNGLNTLEYAQKLKAVGVPSEQAEAHALAIYEIINSNLATKQDIALVKRDIELVKRDIKDLDLKIEATKAELKRDIKELELKIENSANKQTIKLGSLLVIALGAIVAFSKLGII